jgi:hypothetical protein
LYVVFRARPGQPCGMITIVGHILQKEHIFGLWRGMTPVSFDPLIAIITFPLDIICVFYVKVPENTYFDSKHVVEQQNFILYIYFHKDPCSLLAI